MRISDWSSDVCSSDLLALTLEKKRKIETAGKSLDESAEAEIQRLYEKIELRKRDEQSIWEALLKRHFGLLFEAFHAHPDKARLFIRMIDYCRAPGPDGFSRLGEWMSLQDRKDVVSGKSVAVLVNLGGRRIIKKKKKKKN